MSNQRKSQCPATMKAVLATAYEATPVLVDMMSEHDVYMCGDVMQVVPGLFENAHPTVMSAFLIRRVAALKGECPYCEACASPHSGGRIEFAHESWCIASDEGLARIQHAHPLTDPGRRLRDPEPGMYGAQDKTLDVLEDDGSVRESLILHGEYRGLRQ